MFLIGLIAWRRRRKKLSIRQDDTRTLEKAELPGAGKDIPQLDHDMRVYEVDGDTKPRDIPADTGLAELDGNWTGWEVPETTRR